METEAQAPKYRMPTPEEVVIGAMLAYPECQLDCLSALNNSYFSDQRNRLVFDAIESLYGSGESNLDFVAICSYLDEDMGAINTAGGASRLMEMAENSLTTTNLPYYIDKILEESRKRKLLDMASTVHYQLTAEGASPNDVLADIQKLVVELSTVRKKDPELPQLVDEVLADITARLESQNTIKGITTGFPDLDAVTEGLTPSDLVTIGGRPGMGKTALALNLAANVAKAGGKSVFFSIEMSLQQLVERTLYSIADSRTQLWRLQDAAAKLKGLNIVPLDRVGLDLMTTRAALMKHRDADLVIVDYLQLMKGQAQNRAQEVSALANGLKEVAREFNTCVIALAQLSRAVELRQDKHPQLSDLKESSGIEDASDEVWLMYRDEYYNKGTDRPGTVDISIAKNRDGETKPVSLLFRGTTLKFLPMNDAKIRVF